MEIVERREGEELILELRGSVGLDGPARVRAVLSGLVDEGRRKITLETAAVTQIAPASVAELVQCAAAFKLRGARVKVLNLRLFERLGVR